MNLLEQVALTSEQEQLRTSVRRFFAARSAEPQLREAMETERGFDPEVHRRLAEELGAHGLAVPERFGGAGAGWREVAVVAEEAGRCLYSGPYLSSAVLAVAALLASGDEPMSRDHLPGLGDGSTVGALAFAEDDGRWDAEGTATRAVRAGEGWALTGAKRFVVDGHVADLLLVTAATDEGVGVFAVAGDAAGLTREVQPTLDPTRRLAAVRLESAPARSVGALGDGARVLAEAVQVGSVVLAAEQLGAAQRLLELSTGYANTRRQFGRPIGAFQGVKHLCADILLGVESARSLAHHASWSLAEGRADAPLLASAAKSLCSEVFLSAAATTIQVHGGIGFTWEHPAHLYYRRAKSDELMFGTPGEHRARLAARLGL
jgi:alkylation response protein AidB-like acyl-CoA dehydrogenase